MFWSAKFKSLSREHEKEMGRVRAEVELMRASAEGARSELEREMAARKENDNQVIFCQQLTILHTLSICSELLKERERAACQSLRVCFVLRISMELDSSHLALPLVIFWPTPSHPSDQTSYVHGPLLYMPRYRLHRLCNMHPI